MSANIWNTYEMVGAAVTGVLIGGVPAIAAMILLRKDGRIELAEAQTAWSNAIKVQEANDRARWAPAYSPNLFAIEAAPNADPHVTGELVAVESACCDAHNDEPCTPDAGFVFPCCDSCPDWAKAALADEPHHDDEDAPSDDTDRTGMGRVLLALAVELWGQAVDWLTARWAALQARRNERYLVGSGEQAVEPGEAMREVLAASGYDLDPDGEALVELEAWIEANPPSNHGPDGQRHWNDVTAMHGIVTPGRHRRDPDMPAINASIPAQRTGDADE